MYAWADRVVADHGTVNLIVNNAGVALGATVESMSYEDFEWLMNINFWGVVYGTKAFLPHLKASGEGHIVNLSSVFGLISVPSQSAYNAAKFAVRGFTDTLAHGARDRTGHRLGDDDPPRWDQDQHRAQRPHGSERRPRWPAIPRRPGRDFERAFITSPREGGPTDPHRRPARPPARARSARTPR